MPSTSPYHEYISAGLDLYFERLKLPKHLLQDERHTTMSRFNLFALLAAVPPAPEYRDRQATELEPGQRVIDQAGSVALVVSTAEGNRFIPSDRLRDDVPAEDLGIADWFGSKVLGAEPEAEKPVGESGKDLDWGGRYGQVFEMAGVRYVSVWGLALHKQGASKSSRNILAAIPLAAGNPPLYGPQAPSPITWLTLPGVDRDPLG